MSDDELTNLLNYLRNVHSCVALGVLSSSEFDKTVQRVNRVIGRNLTPDERSLVETPATDYRQTNAWRVPGAPIENRQVTDTFYNAVGAPVGTTVLNGPARIPGSPPVVTPSTGQAPALGSIIYYNLDGTVSIGPPQVIPEKKPVPSVDETYDHEPEREIKI